MFWVTTQCITTYTNQKNDDRYCWYIWLVLWYMVCLVVGDIHYTHTHTHTHTLNTYYTLHYTCAVLHVQYIHMACVSLLIRCSADNTMSSFMGQDCLLQVCSYLLKAFICFSDYVFVVSKPVTMPILRCCIYWISIIIIIMSLICIRSLTRK